MGTRVEQQYQHLRSEKVGYLLAGVDSLLCFHSYMFLQVSVYVCCENDRCMAVSQCVCCQLTLPGGVSEVYVDQYTDT